jgi:hypothetical protein
MRSETLPTHFSSRIKAIADGKVLTLTIRPARSFVMMFLQIWLALWTLGIVAGLTRAVIDGSTSDTVLTLIAAIVFGGPPAFLVYQWSMAHEMIKATTDQLQIMKDRQGPVLEFEASRIQDVHLNRDALPGQRFFPLWNKGSVDAITFDYKSFPVTFGSALTEAEAVTILKLLKQRFGYDVRIE